MNKKILVCSHTGIFKGGAERSLYLFLKHTPIPKERFLVSIPFYERHGLYDELVKIGIPAQIVYKDEDPTHFSDYLRNPFVFLRRIALRLRFSLKFLVLLRGYRPDLVYINTRHCGTEALVSRILGQRIVYHIRGLMGGWKYRLPIIKSTASEIIVVSRSEKQRLLENHCRQPVTVIANGIELDLPEINKHRPEKSKGRVVVLNVSNIEPRKGTDVFFRVAEEMIRKKPDVEFWQVGRVVAEPSVFYNHLVKKYARPIKDRRLLLFGYQENIYDFIDKCDVFLFPSRQEGFARVVLEAMLLGKPVVSFNLDGQRDQVVHDETGYLVENEEEMLAKARLLIDNRPLRERLGQNGRRRVRDYFDVARYVRDLTERLLSVLDK